MINNYLIYREICMLNYHFTFVVVFFLYLLYIIKTAMATQQCVECSDVSSLDLCTQTVECAHDEVEVLYREV